MGEDETAFFSPRWIGVDVNLLLVLEGRLEDALGEGKDGFGGGEGDDGGGEGPADAAVRGDIARGSGGWDVGDELEPVRGERSTKGVGVR
jgi:hypothetical protein